MKTLKYYKGYALYILLCTVFVGGCNVTSEKEETTEVTSEVTSEIVEYKLDYSRMPSYCKVNSYKIVKVPKGYIIQLSGGTVDSDPIYKTPEQAQKDINDRAARSKKRWIDSGGLDF